MKSAPLQFHITTDAMFAENGYVVYSDRGQSCWVIDPGLPPQAEQIIEFISHQRLSLAAVILTHAHGDHIAGVDAVRHAFDTPPLYLAREEWAMLSDSRENLSADLGLNLTVRTNDLHDLSPGDELTLDGHAFAVLDTAGHSPGGRSLYCPAQGMVWVGDALFAGSIGRTDFHHSDHRRLIANIHTHLLILPDETRALSGHGPETTIGQEKRSNPFLQEST